MASVAPSLPMLPAPQPQPTTTQHRRLARPVVPPPGPATHLGGLDLAVAQHLSHQAADERLALVRGAAQPRALDAVPHRKHPPAVARRRKAAAAGLRRCGACTGGDRVRVWGRQAAAGAASSGGRPGAHHAFAPPRPPASCWGMPLLARRPLKAGSASLCCCGRCTLTRGRAARIGAKVKQLMATEICGRRAARIGGPMARHQGGPAACCGAWACRASGSASQPHHPPLAASSSVQQGPPAAAGPPAPPPSHHHPPSAARQQPAATRTPAPPVAPGCGPQRPAAAPPARHRWPPARPAPLSPPP